MLFRSRNANRDRMLSPVEVFGPMPEHGVGFTRRQRNRCRDDYLPVAAEEPTGLPESKSTVAWLVREPTGSPVGRLSGRGRFLANGGSPNSDPSVRRGAFFTRIVIRSGLSGFGCRLS